MEQTKILVVEDERIIAFDLVNRLQALGFAVEGFATRGDEAIRRTLAERPDLVLMDIHLEGNMDGIAAAQTLYGQTRIPVVFLTAYADDDTLRRAQAALPFGYLLKPCQNAEIKAAIQMALARREAEARLERSEERQRLALDAARLGVWEWQADSPALGSAGHLAEILGAPPDSVASWDDFLARVHSDDRAALLQALAGAKAGNGSLDLVFRLLPRGAHESWVEAHARAFSATPPAPARVIGVLKDITERREIEQKLRQAATVYEATAEGIFIADAAGTIVSVNPAFTALTGYAPHEAVGADAETLLLPARRSGDATAPPGGGETLPGEIKPGETTRQGEALFRRKNGEVFSVWENRTEVRPPQGGAVHTIVVFADISALSRAEAELHELAHFDPLTGLPNRRLFNERLEQALERGQRDGANFALLFIDLDNFKAINDTLGHGAGDQLLRTVATRISEQLRHADTLARLGGDEFVVLLYGIQHPEDGARIAKKILDALAEPVALGREHLGSTASIGVSVYPDDGIDATTLFRAADTAMYQAKSEGRNRYCFFTRDMATRAAERMGLEQGLRRALAQGELLLHYQPQVGLADGRLTGFEALARWQRPGEGLIPPDRFIPVAEECGLIEDLGRWVLAEACAQGVRWRTIGWNGRLAVNVSGYQLRSEQFVETLRDTLAASGFPAQRLELELTESSLLAIEGNCGVLDRLKQLGVQLAIDDFGTGYSSLSVLKHLPIDRLKIDRSFVKDLPGDADDAAIVAAICALARTLGLKLLAEGVETVAQQASLRHLGCDEAQGYGYSRPLPVADIDALLRATPPWRGAIAGTAG